MYDYILMELQRKRYIIMLTAIYYLSWYWFGYCAHIYIL